MAADEFGVPAERGDRERTLTELIETIDEAHPETKQELSDAIGLSGNYVSELLKELKESGLVKKAYVVDEAAVLQAAPELTELTGESTERGATNLTRIGDRLRALDDVTVRQYEAARTAFEGGEPEERAADLEPLANERSRVAFDILKSMTISTEWPGNRVAADLGTIAMNMEIIGDRACFLEDVAGDIDGGESVVHDRLRELFDDGLVVHDLTRSILFDVEPESLDELYGVEDEIHRRLDELFELVTTYDPELYGPLASLSRTLEQTIYYWVHTAEMAVRLHTGITPEHISTF